MFQCRNTIYPVIREIQYMYHVPWFYQFSKPCHFIPLSQYTLSVCNPNNLNRTGWYVNQLRNFQPLSFNVCISVSGQQNRSHQCLKENKSCHVFIRFYIQHIKCRVILCFFLKPIIVYLVCFQWKYRKTIRN